MSEILNLLEQIATDAKFVNQVEVKKLITESELDEALKAELLNHNIDALKEALSARSKVFCGIFPAEDDESEEQEEQDDDSQNEAQSKIAVND